MRVALVFGGRSSEHEVSLRSADSVRAALLQSNHEVVDIGITPAGRWLVGEGAQLMLESDGVDRIRSGLPQLPDRPSRAALGQVDVVFPVLHGPNGEDGSLQGLLELANVPYVGCGVLGSALAMDKVITKQLLGHAGIPQTPYLAVAVHDLHRARSEVEARIEATLTYPLFVKPANLGSSVGISRVEDRTELAPALDLAAAYDLTLLVETAVPHARELEVSVLGHHNPEASVPGEIVPSNQFYDYRAKYHNPDTRLLIPAPVPAAMAACLQTMAIQAFRLLRGCGMARVDFLVAGDSHTIYLNELNTIPGFTAVSMYPKLWEASGVSYAQLIDRLLAIALDRHTRKQALKTSI